MRISTVWARVLVALSLGITLEHVKNRGYVDVLDYVLLLWALSYLGYSVTVDLFNWHQNKYEKKRRF
jgi:hypothetical protein